MTVPTFSGQTWPPTGTTADDRDLQGAVRAFMPHADVGALKLATMRAFLGIPTGATATVVDAESAINAQRAHQPHHLDVVSLRSPAVRAYLNVGSDDIASRILASHIFGP